ncbi:MAG: hypothetical protein ABIJ12_04120 [bacterium]
MFVSDTWAVVGPSFGTDLGVDVPAFVFGIDDNWPGTHLIPFLKIKQFKA